MPEPSEDLDLPKGALAVGLVLERDNLLDGNLMENLQSDLKSSLVGATSYSVIHRHLKKDSPMWQKMHYYQNICFSNLGPS